MNNSEPHPQNSLDAEQRSLSGEIPNNEPENAYEPIKCGDWDKSSTIERTTSRRSLQHTWSLNDGYGYAYAPELDGTESETVGNRGINTSEFILVDWDENDPTKPRNMRYGRKWLIVILISLGSACVTCASSMYTLTYGQLTKEFHCSVLVATLGLTSYTFGLGIGPLFLAPLSEFYGRRVIYLVSFTFFVIWLIPCAVAQNIETMIVVRFFSGVAGSAFLSVAPGTVGDLFDRTELGAPMMVYTASPFAGPPIGPLVAGFISEFSNWRWTFYVLIIWSGIMLVCFYLFVPETYHPVLLKRKAARLRKETGVDKYIAPMEKTRRSVLQTILRSIYRPMLLLVLEPMCLNLCIFSAILLGILYLFFGAFPLVFMGVYGFSLWQTGVAFIGILVGMILAILTDPLWRMNYIRLERKYQEALGEKDDFMPEWRLPPAICGAPLVTVGIFIFGWTAYPQVHWIAPIIGTAVFGAGTVLVYAGIFTFLVDAYPLYAASALAANTFVRSTFSGVFPLFGVQMYNTLGYHWAASLLGFLTVAMIPLPYIFYLYGSRIRKRSRFAASDI